MQYEYKHLQQLYQAELMNKEQKPNDTRQEHGAGQEPQTRM